MAEQQITQEELLKTARALHPELGTDDEAVTQQILNNYPMLRRRVVDPKGQPVWKGGQADTLKWTGSTAQDGDYNGKYSWESSQNNKPVSIQTPPKAHAPFALPQIEEHSGRRTPDAPTLGMPIPQQLSPSVSAQNDDKLARAKALSNSAVSSGFVQRGGNATPKMMPVSSVLDTPIQRDAVVSEPDPVNAQQQQQQQQQPAAVSQPAPTDMAPSARQPYDFKAQDYSDKANTLEAQAKPPARPQGFLKNLVIGASEGLQGANHPGGFAGFKAEQQGQERQREQDLLGRAKQYREESQREQGLGLTEEQRQTQNEAEARQEKRNTDMFNLKVNEDTETARHNKVVELRRPNVPQGDAVWNPDIKKYEIPAPKSEPKPVPGRDVPFSPDVVKQKEDITAAGKTPPQAQIVWQKDPSNPAQEVAVNVDKAGKPGTPALDDQGKQLTRIPAGQQNATAKSSKDFEDANKSLTAIRDLAAQNSSAADKALVDQYFNVIRPSTGGRMSSQNIQWLATPGPLQDRLRVQLQKLDGGQPLDPAYRQEIIHAAEAVVHSKDPANGGGATGDSFYKPGGALEALAKRNKVNAQH